MWCSIVILFFIPSLLASEKQPDLRKKAAALLESSEAMIGGTPPEFQPGALLQLAVVQSVLDRRKSVELFEQALAAGTALPQRENLRSRFLAMTVAALVKVDVDRGIEKLYVIPEAPVGEPDPRSEPINQIVAALLEQSGKKPDRAVEVIERFGLSGAYPYRAAANIIQVLPPEDPRRLMLFSLAQSAFSQRPDIDELERFVREFRPGKPVAMSPAQLETAVRAMVRSAMEGKGIVYRRTQTITTSEGTVSLQDPQDVVLFNLVDLARAVDADLVEHMIENRPALQIAVKRFPMGKQSVEHGEGITTSGIVPAESEKTSAAEQARARRLVAETARFQEVMTWYTKDPQRALASARLIPTPVLKVRAIATIAMNQRKDDRQAAIAVLEECVKALEEVRPVGNRAMGWSTLALAADNFQDRALAVKLLEKGIADAGELYKTDSDRDSPNLAPRPFWPSAAAYRALFYRAAKMLGGEAEALLDRCPDPGLQTLGRVEIAAAWLGIPSTPATTQVFRDK